MNPWVAVRRPWIVLLGVVLYVLALVVVREGVVHAPSITVLGTAPMKLMNFVPLIVCLALVLCLDRRLGPAELTGVRRVDLADRALVVGAVAALLSVGLVLHTQLSMPSATAAARNSMLLIGLALLVRARFGGTVAVSAATGWLFVNLVGGLRGPQDPYPWAVLLEGWNHPWAAAVCVVIFVLGLVSLRSEPPRS